MREAQTSDRAGLAGLVSDVTLCNASIERSVLVVLQLSGGVVRCCGDCGEPLYHSVYMIHIIHDTHHMITTTPLSPRSHHHHTTTELLLATQS